MKNKVPDEVKVVWILTHSWYGEIPYFGKDTFERIRNIIRKHPEYFPEEEIKSNQLPEKKK